MGVDRGIHVEVSGPEYDTLQPIHVSKILAKLAQDEKADVVIVGKQVNERLLQCFMTLLIYSLPNTFISWLL
jgi:electron transfer flavoprotein alpha/beta subunit